MTIIKIPDLSLVLLIGIAGSGKSTFAQKHFKPTEIISSDECRGFVSDDPADQSVSKEAFEVLHFIASKRMALGRLTVIDATNVSESARLDLLKLAHHYHFIPVAIVFHLPESLCIERSVARHDRFVDSFVIHNQFLHLEDSLPLLEKEGFKRIFILNSEDEIHSVQIERERMHSDLRHDTGPFDIIGDIHGCFGELLQLLQKLGYQVNVNEKGEAVHVAAPMGRKVIFLGDLVDRGPNAPAVLQLAMKMVEEGKAYCVAGNHDAKLLRKLQGANVKISHGLHKTLEQLEFKDQKFIDQVIHFLDHLSHHYVLDGGNLVVAHAGLKEEFQGRSSGKVRAFALFGTTTTKFDAEGYPLREAWAQDYHGNAWVVYGHTIVAEPLWLNRTVNIDTGCVFGGKLTALRYPEMETVSVPSFFKYADSSRPF